ncbi:MAG: DUF6522 family protein [Roseovarius sp.]|nr:DUF6522 family protein [Roseovarius sp.]
MTTIEFQNGTVEVDAGILARAFRIGTDDLKRRMREGTITSRCERGEGTDAGRMRLSFYSPDRRVQVIAEESGRILTCTAADYTRRGAPAKAQPDAAGAARKSRLDALLDTALQGTFPASDPIALDFGNGEN